MQSGRELGILEWSWPASPIRPGRLVRLQSIRRPFDSRLKRHPRNNRVEFFARNDHQSVERGFVPARRRE
jgi:hypothetical protein